MKSYSRFSLKKTTSTRSESLRCRKVPTSFQWGFQDQDLRHQWCPPKHQRPRMLQCGVTLPGHTGHQWRPRDSQGWQNRWLLLADLGGADGGTSSNGDPIAPTLSAILGRGSVTLAKCVVLRLSALFFADEKTVPWKITIEEGVFFDSLVPTAHLQPIYCPRKLKNSPLEMMVGFGLCSSLQIGFLSGDLLIFRASLDVSENSGCSPKKSSIKK